MNSQLLQNIHKSPVSTIAGLLLGAALVVSGQPNWQHLLAALAAAILGAVTKEN